VADAGIAATLWAAVEPAVARVFVQAAITLSRIIQFAPAIYGGLAIGGLALEALNSIAQNLSNTKLQIAPNAANDVRGNEIEDAALQDEDGALDHNFPKIDYYNDGFALSIKSHAAGSKDALLDAIKGDLRDISNVENESLEGNMRDGSYLTIDPGDIKTKGLLVAIPRTDASVIYEDGFLEELQSLSDEYETAIKVVGIEGWE
jgi:hypothetical protein